MTADTDDVDELLTAQLANYLNIRAGYPQNPSMQMKAYKEMLDALVSLIHDREVRARESELNDLATHAIQLRTLNRGYKPFVALAIIQNRIAALHTPTDGKEK